MIAFALLLLQLALAPYIAAPGQCPVCKLRGVKTWVMYGAEVKCPRGVVCGAGQYEDSGRFVPAGSCQGCWQVGRCEKGHVVRVEVGK